MKKRLEADLISIAHRILQLKNKSDVNQLFLETQKLYEKLSVLKFVEEQYGETKPTIGHSDLLKDVEAFYDKEGAILPEISKILEENIEETPAAEVKNEEVPADEEVIFTPEIVSIEEVEDKTIDEEVIVEAVAEKPEEEIIIQEKPKVVTPPAFKPAFELNNEEDETQIVPEIPKKNKVAQISFEDLLGGDYNEPQFVKVEDVPALPEETVFEAIDTNVKTKVKPEKTASKPFTLNDKLSKVIEIDLNDQIAFVKHLFGNSREDYNRVMSQLNTFDNFYETKNFIQEMVKPDYNDWQGKADYEERFMDIIENKFL